MSLPGINIQGAGNIINQVVPNAGDNPVQPGADNNQVPDDGKRRITFQSNDKLPSLQDYKKLLEGAKVLDGDIIIKNNQLQKVNYGSGAANIFTFGLSNRRVRGTEEQNFESRAKFWMALKNASVGTGVTEAELDAIAEALGLEVTNEDGVYSFKEMENAKSTDALARRTIAHFVEIFEAKQDRSQQAGQAGQAVAPQEPPKPDDGKTYIGGEYGLRLTKEQFNGIFGQLESRGLAQKFLDEALDKKNVTDPNARALYAKAMSALIKECRNRFAAGGASNGLFERLFSDGLGIDAIAKKVAATVTDSNFTLTDVSPDKRIDGGVISAEARKLVDGYRNKLETMGSKRVGDLSNLTEEFFKPDDTITKNPAAKFVSELLFNSNAEEIDRTGFQGGYRIANLLLKNADIFKEVCESVKSGTTTTKDNKDNTYGTILHRLDEIAPGLSESFTKMIADVNTKCFGGGVSGMGDDEKFRLSCLANKDKLLAAVVNSKMEEALDTAAKVKLQLPQFTGQLPKGLNMNNFIEAMETAVKSPTTFVAEGTFTVEKMIAGFCRNLDSKRTFTEPEKKQIQAFYEHLEGNKEIAELMKNTGHSRLMVELGSMLGVYSRDGTFQVSSIALGENMASSLSSNASPQSLRRLLAAGFRYSSDTDGKFNPSRIMLELGPMAHKLLQGADDRGNEDLKTTLGYIRGNLPRLDPAFVKAQLFGYLTETLSPQELENIKGVQIKKSIAAASIADTVLASIQYENRTVDVVFKLVRPDVERKFNDESSAIQKNLRDKLNGLLASSDRNTSAIEDVNNAINGAHSLASTVGREFDLTTEFRTALKSYAALQDSQAVRSMGLVLKDPDGRNNFENALQAWKNDPSQNIDNIANNHLMMASKSCMLAEVAEGQTVDKQIMAFEEKLKKFENIKIGADVKDAIPPEGMDNDLKTLAKLNTNLQELARKSVDTMLNGKPPMLHLDLHGSNIMTNGVSVTLIDHGKEFNITDKERECYRKLLTLKKEDGTGVQGGELREAFKTLLEQERERYKDNDLIKGNIDNTINKLDEDFFEGWADGRGMEGFSGYTTLKNTMERIRQKGLYIPTGLDGLKQTFEKLSAAQGAVKKVIERYSKAKEMFDVGLAAKLDAVEKKIDDWGKKNGVDLDNTETKIAKLKKELSNLKSATLEMGLEEFDTKIDAIGKGFKDAVAWKWLDMVTSSINTVEKSVNASLNGIIAAKEDAYKDGAFAKWLDAEAPKLEEISKKLEVITGNTTGIDRTSDGLFNVASSLYSDMEELGALFAKNPADDKVNDYIEGNYKMVPVDPKLQSIISGFADIKEIVDAEDKFNENNPGGKKLFFSKDFPEFTKSAGVDSNYGIKVEDNGSQHLNNIPNTIEDILNDAVKKS